MGLNSSQKAPNAESRSRSQKGANSHLTTQLSLSIDWEKEELALLLADWKQRQREIVVRSRAENYNFILVITSLATIGGLFIAFRSDWAEIYASLPTITAIGAFLLSVLPVNLAHVATTTELRRHYLELRVEPQIIAIVGRHTQSSVSRRLLTFEQFDRYEHRKYYNTLIVGRAIFSLAPSAVLGTFSAITTLQQMNSQVDQAALWEVVLNLALVFLGFAMTVLSIIALSSMWRRTLLIRRTHVSYENSLELASPLLRLEMGWRARVAKWRTRISNWRGSIGTE